MQTAFPLSDKHALVLGLGETGLSLVKWLTRKGCRVRVADSREAPPNLDAARALAPDAEIRTGPYRADDFKSIDLIAVSPGVAVDGPLAVKELQAARAQGVPVFGDIELFAQAVGPNAHVLAITGTNGKTTVTALAGHLCAAAGLDVCVAGNIGPAALDALIQRIDGGGLPQVWVLELSSYQLETTTSLLPVAAVMLNLSEDHLDRYVGMADYGAAKSRIFHNCPVQILNRGDAASMGMFDPVKRHITFGLTAPARNGDWGLINVDGAMHLARCERDHPVAKIALADMQITGLHNATNAMAALALCEALGLPLEKLLIGLRSFKGLPHRVETIADIDGVTYIDDSKGTNVGATVAALSGLSGKTVLIAGGDGKGQDFTPLASALRDHARAVVLIGRDAGRIHEAIRAVPMQADIQVEHASTLEEAVACAARFALPGDSVLLSPACASFDMFKSYLHRSEVFSAAVAQLKSGGSNARAH